MNQNDEMVRFLVLPYDILSIKELNITDKFVLARISGFKRFFESSETTAEFLRLTKVQVERAKRKLAKLGYIIELENTGRGKVYRCQDLYLLAEKIDGECHIRPDKKVRSDMTKMSGLTLLKCKTENKERINREYIIKDYIGDENIAECADETKKEEFGRADINELADLWEQETGFSIKGNKKERNQLYNLLRKYGSDATKTLVMRVGVVRRSDDQFKPQSASPSDLTGKYSKLNKLVMWEERQKVKSRAEEQELKEHPMPSYLRGGTPDYNGAFIPVSDEEHEKVSQMFKDFRETAPFLQKKGDKQ